MGQYNKEKVEAATRLLLEGLGENLSDPNIIETPERVAKMYQITLGGHDIDPKQYLKFFPDENDEPVIVRNIPFFSMCAHHMMPFYGKFTIAYIGGEQVLGLSKLVRIARAFAKKLQLQERLTREVAQFLFDNIPSCKGVAVSIRSHHTCMTHRGARAYGSETVTTKLLGEFKTNENRRKEFTHALSDKEGY